MFQKLLKPEIVIYKGPPNEHFHKGMTGEATHTDSPGEFYLVNWHTQKAELPQEVNIEDLHFASDLMIYV